jgi:hypothetical protein
VWRLGNSVKAVKRKEKGLRVRKMVKKWKEKGEEDLEIEREKSRVEKMK